ncbi:hypothetical protein BC629DRAFT_892297 [Irpex lacteus]|nr:hypothetical protein BC629DRAFT_892297 [Irpex lacteus]
MQARDVGSGSTRHKDTHQEVIYAPFGAARTWRALVLYLYDGNISFSPLQTSPTRSKCQGDTSCSPKSMYHLAKKLELNELATVCKEAIITDLCPANIIDELFSDFTWRHREILDREVLVFMKHSQDDRVRLYLKQALKDMALGKLSRRDIVLSALFDSMLPPVV